MTGPLPPPTWRSVTLTLPYERPPKALWGNARVHWRRRSADTQMVRSDVVRLAQAAGLHRLGPVRHLEVQLVWAPGDHRRRDSDNLNALQKVVVDGLARGPRKTWTGLDIVPDDTDTYVTRLPPRIEPPPAKGMWLHLRLDMARPQEDT